MTKPDLMAELLPCPFCGGEAERIDFGPGDAENDGGSCISCKRCQSSGPVEFGRKENFMANWNRRTHHAELEAAVRDAARYRWLRDEGWFDAAVAKHYGPDITDTDGLEEAIDQAMHTTQEP